MIPAPELAQLLAAAEAWLRRIIRDEFAASGRADRAAVLATVAAYAKARGIGVSTVRAAIREKRLDVTRVGRAIRIAPTATIRPRAQPHAEAAAHDDARTRLGVVR